MMLLLIIVLVLVVGGLVAVVVGRVGADSMDAPTATSAFELPEGPLGAHGVDAVRLDQSLRGYNMAQVDEVLDRLFDEIAGLRAELDSRGARRAPAAHLAGDAPGANASDARASSSDEPGEPAHVVPLRARRALSHDLNEQTARHEPDDDER